MYRSSVSLKGNGLIVRSEKISTLLEEPENEHFQELIDEYNPKQLKGVIFLDPWERDILQWKTSDL